jgi:hypothetical protein
MKKVFLGLLALALVYGLALVGYAWRTSAREDRFVTELHRLGAMGDALKLDDADVSLTDACVAAKVPRVHETQLLAYFPVPDESLALSDDSMKRYGKRRVFGINPHASGNGLGSANLPVSRRGLSGWVFEHGSDFPLYWEQQASWAFHPVRHELDDLKYLVVHQLTSLQLPSVAGTSYSPGHMKFRSALLDAKTGAVLCHGSAVIDQSGSVYVAGSGKTKSDAEAAIEKNKEDEVLSMFFIDLDFFALRPVCSIGGESLCKTTFGAYTAP